MVAIYILKCDQDKYYIGNQTMLIAVSRSFRERRAAMDEKNINP